MCVDCIKNGQAYCLHIFAPNVSFSEALYLKVGYSYTRLMLVHVYIYMFVDMVISML